MEYIVLLAFFFYFIYSFNYTVKFIKTDVYTKRQKTIHLILIWLIPFIWINLLKALLATAPGSHFFKKRDESAPPYESGLGMFEGWDNNSTGDFGGGDFSDGGGGSGDGGGGDGGGD